MNFSAGSLRIPPDPDRVHQISQLSYRINHESRSLESFYRVTITSLLSKRDKFFPFRGNEQAGFVRNSLLNLCKLSLDLLSSSNQNRCLYSWASQWYSWLFSDDMDLMLIRNGNGALDYKFFSRFPPNISACFCLSKILRENYLF